jgi:prephenate dehydrogenase
MIEEDDFSLTFSDYTCVIIGLGLMGGSFAGALKGKCRKVIGFDTHPDVIQIALQRNLIDEGQTDLPSVLKIANIVVLATPVRIIMHLLDEIGKYLSDGCMVIDLGSVKTPITAKMAYLPENVQPIGGHPMCGREISGIFAADPSLYQNAPFILTPLERTSDMAMQEAIMLIKMIGARPIILDCKRHDYLVATISHLPYLVSCNLIDTARSVALSDQLVWEIAASGFRDTTRLAASNVDMSLDILLTNREMIISILNTFQEQLQMLTHLLEETDEKRLYSHLETIYEIRKRLFTTS